MTWVIRRQTCWVAVALWAFGGQALAQPAPPDEPAREPPPVSAVSSAPAPAAPELPPLRSDAEIAACLKQHAQATTTAEAQRRAVRHAGVSREQVDQTLSSARLKGVLPRVSFFGLFGEGQQSSEYVNIDRLYPSFEYRDKSNTNADSDQYYVGGLLTFRLEKLTLDPRSIKASVKAARYRNTLAVQVADLVAKRAAAVLTLCSRQWSFVDKTRHELAVRRHTQALQGLMGTAEPAAD